MPISGKGLSYAMLAYGIWGGFGLYFHLLAQVPATEVLIHRILWSSLFVFGVLLARRQVGRVGAILKTPRTVAWLLLSSVLISGNWGLYIWAVSQARVIEASLGYFLTPLISVLLGVIVLKETLSRAQLLALVIATAGVLWQAVEHGSAPWIALTLGFLFAFYGLIRKQVEVDALTGLLVETALMLPVALIALEYLTATGRNHFDANSALLLIGAGVLTAVPLLAFASAARLLPLSVLGFANYLTPTLQFISAITLLNEPLDSTTLTSFSLIWVALAIFSQDLYRTYRNQRQQATD